MAGIGSLKLALDPEDRAALMLLRDTLSEATHELRRYNDAQQELADEHRAENAAAAYEASEGQYGAPVASQADRELRDEIAAAVCPGIHCESHSECKDDADAVLALPAVRQLLADSHIRSQCPVCSPRPLRG